MFEEQSAKVLEQRFGFRVAEYGLRQLFPRVPDHPILAGLTEHHLRDWRGTATLQPARLDYTLRPRHGPTVKWCDIEVSRAWRCGNRGNVASVLIEKPPRGDFLPILDGGFGLQYSPLMECQAKGRAWTLLRQGGRDGAASESDPAAKCLADNLSPLCVWRVEASSPRRTQAIYAGETPGRKHPEAAGVSPRLLQEGRIDASTAFLYSSGDSGCAEGD